MFPIEKQPYISTLLEKECANNFPFMENEIPESMERIRFAALKIAEGNIDLLKDEIQLAKTDWRDLLVNAEFADDINAHEQWIRKTIS